MAGDNINIFGKSYHKRPSGSGYTLPVNNIGVSELINAFAGTGLISGKGVTGVQITGQPGFPTLLSGLIGTQPAQNSGLPRASINWILFDEQFKWVAGGFDMVGDAGSSTAGTFKNHSILGLPVTKNGYIYVWASNESKYNVFFDNLQLIHNRGPILEETHYYPGGLVMAGISSKSLNFGAPSNKFKFGGKELQSGEFSDGSGLEEYDFLARNYDPQIGRFHQLDPFAEISRRWSPYVYSADNPIRYNDPDGMVWGDPDKDGKIAKRLQDRIAERLKDENGNLEKANKKVADVTAKIGKEGTSKKLEKQLQNAKDDAASATGAISELTASSKELTEMGSADTKQVFTFKEITGSEGGTEKRADGVIEMSITSDANGVHEAKHGYILHSEGPRTRDNFYSHEVRAYTAQYAFDAGTVQNNVPSYWGNVKSPSDITINWVIGIHNGSGGTIGDFIYAKQLIGASYDPKFIMKFLDGERKKK